MAMEHHIDSALRLYNVHDGTIARV